MKLIFYTETEVYTHFNIPVKPLSDDYSQLFIPENIHKGHPPLPIKELLKAPSDKTILYDIHSLDYCLSPDGRFSCVKISEDDAFSLSRTSIIYKCDLFMTPYFRYKDQNGQHTVWFEDTYHQIKKLDILENAGYKSVGIPVNSISYTTIINLVRTERYCI